MAPSGSESGSTTDSESDSGDDYDPLTPYVFDVEYDGGEQPVFHPVLPEGHTTFGPSFQLPYGVDATPGALFELFLPDQLLDSWVVSTNLYSRARLPRDRVNPVSRPELLRFLAIIYTWEL
jgi:Transposase IS4